LVDAAKVVFNDGNQDITPSFVRTRNDSLIVGPTGFVNGTIYSLTIGEGAIANEFDITNKSASLSFRTIMETPAPIILSPEDGKTQVAFDSQIFAVFTPLKVEGFNVGKVAERIMDAGGARIVIDGVTYDNLSVIVRGDSIFVPTLASLDVTAQGKVATITVFANAVSNADGLINEEFSWSFTTYQPLPTLVSSHPENAATKVSLTDSLVFTYDQGISLVDAAKVVFNDGSQDITPSFVRVRNDSMIVGPNGLANGTIYTLQIGAGAVKNEFDLTNKLASIQFRTLMEIPAPLALSPLNGATQVAFDSPIYAVFNALTVEGFNVGKAPATILNGASARIEIDGITFDDLSVTVRGDSVFLPTLASLLSESIEGKLAKITVYADAVSNDDVLGNEEFTWSFTTYQPLPVLVSTSPLNNATKVSLSDSLVFNYDQNITLKNAALVKISDGINSFAPSFVRVLDDKLIVGPNGFTNGTTYTVRVDSGAVVNEFDLVNTKTELSFRTIMSVPAVSTLLPVNNQQRVALDSPIQLNLTQSVKVTDTLEVSLTPENGVGLSGISARLSGDNLLT